VSLQAKRVADTRTELSQVMTPNDANFLGKVFGGSILALIDLTASSTAQRFSGQICVTASVDRVDFHEPIEIGEMVTLIGYVTYVGRTSVEVTIEVTATHLRRNETRHVNTARVTMVAVVDGKSVPVPRLICETREEKLRFLEGRLRRELRQAQSKQLDHCKESIAQLPDEKLDEMLASEAPLTPLLEASASAG
jgi:acyl-CoA hydrolase